MAADRPTHPRVEITAEPSRQDIDLVERNLSAFNRQAGDVADDATPLCVFVKDERGAVLGGATGHTRWGWLYVDCFWLPEGARKGGLGGRILTLAEAEAAARGCRRAYLFTYSFQARGFYEKQGYRVFAVHEDYPPGHRKIWMEKELGGCAPSVEPGEAS